MSRKELKWEGILFTTQINRYRRDMVRTAIFLLVMVFTISCSKEKRFETRYENGNAKETWYYERDTLDGRKERFWENGKLFEVLNYRNGKLNGPYEGYFQNGFIGRKGVFHNGIFHGLYTEYSDAVNGAMIRQIYFVNVKGKEYAYYIKTFDDNGNLKDEERTVSVNVFSDSIGVQAVQLRYVDRAPFDSIKVVLGRFSMDFIAEESTLDTLTTTDPLINVALKESYISEGWLRGNFMIYKATPEGDSTRIDIRIRYFEEKVF
jgi:Uncharacterized protein conserved in bacteria